MAELSTKPYLIRAIHEWCSDSGYRPHIAVVVDERTMVPREFVRNGEIVLNVSTMATNRLQISNDMIEFEARFGGVPRHVSIPIENVSAIYAQETGHGMAFEVPKALALVPEPQGAEDDGARDDGLSGQSAGRSEDGQAPAERGDAGRSASGEPGSARSLRRPTLSAVPSLAPESAAPKLPKRRRKDPEAGAQQTHAEQSDEGSAAEGESGARPGPRTRRGAQRADHKAPGVGEKGSGVRDKASGAGDKAAPATPPDDEPSPPPAGRPRLTRVK